MFTSLVLGAAFTVPAAPIPRDTDPAPVSPAPWVVYLKADPSGQVRLLSYKVRNVKRVRNVVTVENGNRVVKQVHEDVPQLMPTSVALNEIGPKFTTADGRRLPAEAVLKRAKEGFVALVSADGKPVEKSWLRAVSPDAVVVTADALAGAANLRPQITPPTAGPRLVLLGTAPDGRVKVAYNPAAHPALAQDAGNGLRINRRVNRVVFVNNGGVQQRIVINDGGNNLPNPVSAEAPVKGLEDVTFEAYTLAGKLVPRADALARLKAGGLVLVAGENRLPDAAYLSAFRGDLLVLVSAELVNVPTGGAHHPGLNRPVPPVRVVPLPAPVPVPAPAPAVQPAVVKPAVIRLNAVPAQPFVLPVQKNAR